jgi:hypothetical protein
MLRRVALVRTDVSEELSASFIRVTRIGELGTTLAVTSNRRTPQRNTKTISNIHYSLGITPKLTKLHTRRKIPEDAILHYANTIFYSSEIFLVGHGTNVIAWCGVTVTGLPQLGSDRNR